MLAVRVALVTVGTDGLVVLVLLPGFASASPAHSESDSVGGCVGQR